MLTVADAYREVRSRARPLPAKWVPACAGGRVLAEDVRADIDSPPFDKALVDGFAVRSADLPGPDAVALAVLEEIPAGSLPSRPLGKGEASAIMTGAPLPDGADAVVMVEHSRREGDRVVLSGPVRPGQNRLDRGREMRAGEIVLKAGTLLNAARIGLLGAVGRDGVRAIPKPYVSIVPTGNELVPVDETPGPGQIRESNGRMLATLIRAVGGSAWLPAPVAPDEPDGLREALRAAKMHPLSDEPADILLISGGVSEGTRDLVPSALESLGITPVFHKVRVRPGKPLWFGVGPGGTPLVFGLPGNPVSGLVGTLLFVVPAIRAMRGLDVPEEGPVLVPARLAAPFAHRGDRETFHPARIVGREQGVPRLEPLSWAGSPDLRAVTLADGFAHFAAGDRAYRAGEEIGFLPLDDGTCADA